VKTDAGRKPNGNAVHGVSWERGRDPWHADAFPDGCRHAGNQGEPRVGWVLLDWEGTVVGFVPDGTETALS
jgi:hypothetical protein